MAAPVSQPGARPVQIPAGTTPLAIPLRYVLIGQISAVLFGIGAIFILPGILAVPQGPHVLALVHTVTLGWVTMTMMGVLYQLVPVILVTKLRTFWLAHLQYGLYLTGVVLMIGAFWVNALFLLAIGGSLVVTAAVLFVIHMGLTIAQSERRPITAAYLIASLTYLLAVVGFGLTAALNFIWGFLGPEGDRFLLIHLTIGLIGWVSLTIIGVSYKLVAMFALVHGHSEQLGWWLLGILNAGTIGLAVMLAVPVPGWTVGIPAALLGGGLLGFVLDYGRMLHARRKRRLDEAQAFTVAGAGWLAIGIALAVALTLWRPANPFAGPWLALGYIIAIGWIGQTISGYLHKILPFLIWNARYGSRVGREKVPLMRDMLNLPLARTSCYLLNVGILTEVVALAAASPLAVTIGGIPVAAGLMGVAANLVNVLRR
jgi:hypothetical protein